MLSYTDAKCASKASSFTIPTGNTSFTFYVSGTAPGAYSIRAQIANLTDGIQKETLTVPPFIGDGYKLPPATAPVQAGAAGYRNLVFYDEFNNDANIYPKGNLWYTANFFSASATLPPGGYVVDKSGYLTILTDASGYSDGLATADPAHTATGTWQHGYFEARLHFDPAASKGGAWPAFWSYSLEGIQGKPVNSTFGELDFAECYPLRVPCTYITTVHQWKTDTTGANTSVAQNSNNVPTIPANTDFTKWHTYGVLWTPTQVQWYFDDQLVTTVAVGPGTDFTAMDTSHMVVILGTGKNWPMDVDWVHIWH